MNITKRALKAALNIETDADLARFFATSRQNVGQWGGEDDPIPDGRQWQARALRPDLFPTPPAEKAA